MKKLGKYFVCDRRLYWDSEKKKVVEEGDAQAAYLYTAVGHLIPDSMAGKIPGLSKRRSKKAPVNKARDKGSNK